MIDRLPLCHSKGTEGDAPPRALSRKSLHDPEGVFQRHRPVARQHPAASATDDAGHGEFGCDRNHSGDHELLSGNRFDFPPLSFFCDTPQSRSPLVSNPDFKACVHGGIFPPKPRGVKPPKSASTKNARCRLWARLRPSRDIWVRTEPHSCSQHDASPSVLDQRP